MLELILSSVSIIILIIYIFMEIKNKKDIKDLQNANKKLQNANSSLKNNLYSSKLTLGSTSIKESDLKSILTASKDSSGNYINWNNGVYSAGPLFVDQGVYFMGNPANFDKSVPGINEYWNFNGDNNPTSGINLEKYIITNPGPNYENKWMQRFQLAGVAPNNVANW